MRWLLMLTLWASARSGLAAPRDDRKAIRVMDGFVTRIRCSGRLLASATGNPRLLLIEPVPKEMGCAVLLQSRGKVGRTNLILETTAGTLHRLVDVVAEDGRAKRVSDFESELKGDQP
jgi:hypothetical protein